MLVYISLEPSVGSKFHFNIILHKTKYILLVVMLCLLLVSQTYTYIFDYHWISLDIKYECLS